MKKSLALLLTAIMVATVFTSCGGSENSGGSTASNDSGKVKEVSFWHYFSEPDGPIFEKYVAKYNAENKDGIKVNAEYVPREELLKQYSIGAVSGELPDMGMCDNPDHASYAAMGVLEDITDLYNEWDEANFLEGPLNSCTYEGRIYGLPQNSNCLALFYDVDMLEDANVKVPTTWTELEAACEKLTNPGKGIYGLAICAVGNEEGTFQFIPWLESAGSFDDLTSKGSVAALDFLSKLVSKGYMSKEVINWTQADVEKQFSSGSAAMMINGPWNLNSVTTNAPDKNFGVAKVPREDSGKNVSCLGGENFLICKGGDVESSWKFLTWFCGKETSESYTYEIKKFSPRSDIDIAAQYADDEKMALFADVLPTALPRGPHPKWPEISAAIYTAQQEALTGQKDAATAMADAQVKVDKLMK
jgi:multiple sugar transport system substrate-binding protein